MPPEREALPRFVPAPRRRALRVPDVPPPACLRQVRTGREYPDAMVGSRRWLSGAAGFVVASWGLVALLEAQAPVALRGARLVEVGVGVEYAASQDSALIEGAGPIAVHVLRIDPAKTRTSVRLALGRSPGLERVLENATRTGAIAAVNAGFFLPSGAPAGVLVSQGEFFGLGSLTRGALGIVETPAGQRFLVDRVRAWWLPRSQWGHAWPTFFIAPLGSTSLRAWNEAGDLVGGAGLLVSDAAPVADWSVERLRGGFSSERHPRTMAGVAGDGFLWLFVIDGRQPEHSIGMTFGDLIRLAVTHGLRDAINLDGGGSTTMVVQGRVVNRPSDLTGQRAVSDVLAVHAR